MTNAKILGWAMMMDVHLTGVSEEWAKKFKRSKPTERYDLLMDVLRDAPDLVTFSEPMIYPPEGVTVGPIKEQH